MKIDIPGYKELELSCLVLDYNGTIALDGTIAPETKEAICRLSHTYSIYVLTADTHGTAASNCLQYGHFQRALPWKQSLILSAP